ncbi:MAG: aminopeptidase P family protein [Bacteroidales bacterium]
MFGIKTYMSRRAQLREKINDGIVLLLGNGEASYNYHANTYRFRQDSTFLYYFGLQHEDLVGVLDVESGEEIIFGDDYSLDSAIWMGNKPTIKQMASEVGVEMTRPLNQLFALVSDAIKRGRRIHFLPQYRAANLLLLQNLIGVQTTFLSNYVSEELIKAVVSMREIKSAEEIAQIEEACEIGYQMHTHAMKSCRPGMTERDIAGAIEGIALSKGAGVSFHSIVTQHGEILHNHNHDGVLESGRLLLVDAGAETTMNYCSDFTRTFPVNGKFTSVQRDIYQVAQKAYEDSIAKVAPGIAFKDIHLNAAKIVAQGMKDLGLMKGNVEDAVIHGAHALFFPTGLGHQMGLDVHDMEGLGERFVGYDNTVERSGQFGLAYLRMAKKLKPGHVMTVEPGIYFIPILIEKWFKEGINHDYINFDKVKTMLDFGGIRIEDDVLVTENGHRILSQNRIPFTVESIESIMMK